MMRGNDIGRGVERMTVRVLYEKAGKTRQPSQQLSELKVYRPEDGRNKILRNPDNHLCDCMVQWRQRPEFKKQDSNLTK